MNDTIDYYNRNANQYFGDTVSVDFAELRENFAKYLPECATIMDMGCGSGRDVKAFQNMGYNAVGLDASKELASQGREKLGVEIVVGDISEWIAKEPFDGIWCCASILHLTKAEEESFFKKLRHNLKPGGIIFISVKEGIETGPDEKGRYMRNHNEEELIRDLHSAGCTIISVDRTEDKLGRGEFRWLNVIARKETVSNEEHANEYH